MERPFDRKPRSETSRNRYAQSSAAMPDPFEVANREFGGTPRPFARERITKKPPEQSGEFKKAKNQLPGEEIVEISSNELEEVPSEEAAEAALEMGDSDTIPTREVMPWASTIPNEKSRQQKRAEAKQAEKRTSRSEKTSKSIFDANDDEETSRTSVKKARGFYPPGSLPEVIARMDKVEEDIERLDKQLKNGHEEIVSGTKEMKESLTKELEALRESLTAARKESSPLPATVEAAQPPAQDQPEISWSEVEIDNPDFVAERSKPSRSKKKGEQKPALEGQALLESLANKYGIILSAEARAARLQELDRMIDPVKVAEEARLKELLADDEETLRTTEDITPSNKKSLSGRIRETRARLAELSEELSNARDEKDTLLEYPTAAEEVEFNMAETINEIARTNPKNAIRLRQLHNTFADLEQMKNLLRSEAENLAERYGILIDPTQREAQLTRLQKNVRKLQEEFNQVDDAILSRQERQKETNIFKVRDKLGEEIKKLEEKRQQIRNLYNEAGDRYSAALVSSPEKEIEARIQELREDLDNGFKDTRVVDERIAGLERLKKLLSPSVTAKNEEREDLGIDYSYSPRRKREPGIDLDSIAPEITADEADLPEAYDDDNDVGPLPDSEVEKLQQEYAKYRAPKEERTPSPRVAAGGTLEEKIAAIEQMVKTRRTPSGRWLGVDEVLKFERAANALKKQRPNAAEYLDVQAAEISSNGREIIPPPLPPRKKQKRERGNVDEGIIEMYEAQQKKASEQKQKNIATYEARANTYKTELRGIAEELATYGEQVEIPGEETRRLKNTARSWFKSLWRKVIDRSEITELKKRYETTLERYEEAQQQKNAVERNIPVYERATLTRGPQGFAEVPGRIEERRAEQVEFETELRHLAFTERSAQNLMDCFVLNQRIDGSMLDKKEKLQATDRIERALLKQQAGNKEYKSITQKRFNAIPIVQLDKLATAKEFSRNFEFDEETLEGVESIQNDTERTLKSLEAKVSLGLGTRDERDASRRRLNEFKKLLGGKSPEEMAQRANFMVRAAERIALMEIEDRVLHQDLAIKYGRRIKELKDLLAPKGVSAELLVDLENELKRVVQATKTR